MDTWGLIKNLTNALIAVDGVTTTIGNAGGTSIIDTSLIGVGADSFGNMLVIINPDDRANIDNRGITAFDNTTGEITVDAAFKNGQVAAGTRYIIATFGSTLDLTDLITTVNNIWTIVNGLLVLTETSGTLTTTGALQTIYVNNAPTGLFRPVCIKVDLTNQAGGDTFVLQTSYRIITGGNLILQDEQTFIGVQSPALIDIDLEPNRYGILVSGNRTAGANFDFDWEVCYKAES